MNITQYFKEVRIEMRHVSWPTRQQATQHAANIVARKMTWSARQSISREIASCDVH